MSTFQAPSLLHISPIVSSIHTPNISPHLQKVAALEEIIIGKGPHGKPSGQSNTRPLLDLPSWTTINHSESPDSETEDNSNALLVCNSSASGKKIKKNVQFACPSPLSYIPSCPTATPTNINIQLPSSGVERSEGFASPTGARIDHYGSSPTEKSSNGKISGAQQDANAGNALPSHATKVLQRAQPLVHHGSIHRPTRKIITGDEHLGTVEAQVVYKQETKPSQAALLMNLRFIRQRFRSIEEAGVQRRDGSLIKSSPQTAGFMSRLDDWFGSHNAEPGSGRRPRTYQAESSSGGQSGSDTPSMGTSLGKRKRVGDEDSPCERQVKICDVMGGGAVVRL